MARWRRRQTSKHLTHVTSAAEITYRTLSPLQPCGGRVLNRDPTAPVRAIFRLVLFWAALPAHSAKCRLSLAMSRVACTLCVFVCVCVGCTMCCAKADEAIMSWFGTHTRVGPRNRVSDGGPDSPPPVETQRCGLLSSYFGHLLGHLHELTASLCT